MRNLFLTTALTLGFAAPGFAVQPAEGEKLAADQSYTFWLLDAIKTTDPGKNTDEEGSQVLRQLFEGLMADDPKGMPVPAGASSVDVSEDLLTYTFHLRPEAKWSNGDPVTAGDYVYSWRRLADPATASEYAWYVELMNLVNAAEVVKGEKAPEELGVRAVDDHTLEVKLGGPTPYFTKMLTHSSTFPVPQKVIEAEGDNWTQPGKLVGNGAFTLVAHDLGVRIALEKNPNYWDAANVVMDKVTGLTVNDNNVALTRYLAGELDRVQIPGGQYPRLLQEYPDQAVSIPQACSYAYLFNLGEKGPEALKDVRVRQALSYAMQRDIVVNQILQGGQHAAYNWTHWAIEGFEMPQIGYAGWTEAERLEKAKALLAEAGYGPDNPLKIALQYNTDENHKKIAVATQQFYKQIGVELTLNNVEWKVHTDRLQAGDFEMARYAWCADYNEASTFLEYLRSSGMNHGKFSNADYDKLLEQARSAQDPNADYSAAEHILSEAMPLVPIYHYARADMINPVIKGLPTENVMNNWYAKDLYRIEK